MNTNARLHLLVVLATVRMEENWRPITKLVWIGMSVPNGAFAIKFVLIRKEVMCVPVHRGIC